MRKRWPFNHTLPEQNCSFWLLFTFVQESYFMLFLWALWRLWLPGTGIKDSILRATHSICMYAIRFINFHLKSNRIVAKRVSLSSPTRFILYVVRSLLGARMMCSDRDSFVGISMDGVYCMCVLGFICLYFLKHCAENLWPQMSRHLRPPVLILLRQNLFKGGFNEHIFEVSC